MNTRLPVLHPATDKGFVYVSRIGNAYKIGFTRNGLRRRIRDSGGELVLTIKTGQNPSVLEYLINNRFASKRLPDYNDKDGGKREWFALTAEDLAWLEGLAEFISKPQDTVLAEDHAKTPQLAV